MNRVRLLPDHVANQIAAGEVVERPASVVKELVENSLDAGATRIAVEIVAAGRGLIRVTDDGLGMSRDDALLSLERHATSKITEAADLARVTTMGFRGEALPSVASVSRFTLTTREREAAAEVQPGTQILINGGRILEVREAGAPAGTTVEVRSLFFNVPARRKFLRSDETERAHIQHGLTTAALAHPHVGFSLVLEGRQVWQLPALPVADTTAGRLRALRERLGLLLGGGLALIPVDAQGELASARVAAADVSAPAELSPPAPAQVWGWIGAPGVSRATRDDQHLFVNRRPVENRGLNAALIEGYHNSLMKGRYPLACLFLELDPGEVDVNIHPAKREVKFHRERAVRHFVAQAVRDSLKAWHQSAAPATPDRTGDPRTFAPPAGPADPKPAPARSPAATAGGPSLSKSTLSPPPMPLPIPASSSAPSPAGPPASTARQGELPVDDRRTVTPPPAGAGSPVSDRVPASTPSDRSVDSASATGRAIGVTAAGDVGAPSGPAIVAGEPVPLLAVPLRIVGVVGRLYVVLESDRGLVLLDQHAAHERILYEQMLRRAQSGMAAPSQRLLLPETIEVSPRDAAFLRENLGTLTRLGVGLSEFGDRTFLLDSLPPFVKSGSPRRFALELVDELRAAGASVNSWRLGEAVVAKTVCRHAVKANDPLGARELESLVDDLRRCDMPYTCPHGRPTLIEMSFRELERKFGRIQG